MKTILLVDDNPSFRGVIQQLLESHGYTVLAAEDGEAALRLIEAEPPALNLLLANLVLLAMSGAELGERMRRIYPGLKVLYITGYSFDEVHMPPLDTHSALIKKPVTADVLLGTLRELLDAAPLWEDRV